MNKSIILTLIIFLAVFVWVYVDSKDAPRCPLDGSFYERDCNYWVCAKGHTVKAEEYER